MADALKNLLALFGLMPDTATMTLADAFVYMVMAVFALISIYLIFSFLYGVMRFFMILACSRKINNYSCSPP